jgi:amino acid transporter
MQIEAKNRNIGSGLRTGYLHFPELLAQSIALISPTMTAVLLLPLTFASAGQGTWLTYVFGTIMLLFVVFNLNQFARRSASAGSMYAYTSKGLGAIGGILSGWSLVWAYLFISIAGMNGFAYFGGQLLASLGISANIPSVIFFIISGAICWFLAYQDIKLSSILTLVLEALSVALILILAAIVLIHNGSVIDTNQLTLKGATLPGLSLGVVACIFSLVGFESATALGGEAKNPLRTIPRAVIWSLILTGSFFVIMAYVEIFGLRGYKTSFDQIGAPLNVLSDLMGVSFFKIPLSIGAMISFFSLSLSCLNAGARILFPMGRHGVLPSHIGKAHKTHMTPHVAISFFALIMVLIPVVTALSGTDTLTAFNDAGTYGAIGFLAAYFLISIAAPAYLRRDGQLRVGHIIVSALAVLCLLVPAYSLFYPVPAYPVNLFPYIFLAYMAIVSVWLFINHRRNPDMLEDIKRDLESVPEHFDQGLPGESETETPIIGDVVPAKE